MKYPPLASRHPACARMHANATFRTDPTRTTLLRQRFEADLVRRFERLKELITEVVETENGFGVQTNTLGVRVNAGKFAFDRDQQKADAFMKWLRQQERAGILEIKEGEAVSSVKRPWTNKYIQSAYQKGIANAGAKIRGAGATVEERWITSAFNRPVHADRVAQIYTRTYRDLDGITKEMDKRISQTLAIGLAEGRSPRDLARDLRREVDAIGITRARTLARTEIVAAHAEANLTAYQEAGVQGVDVEAEWSTAADPCPECEELQGREFTIEEARGLLPAHPNCRCAWTPKITNGTGIELR